MLANAPTGTVSVALNLGDTRIVLDPNNPADLNTRFFVDTAPSGDNAGVYHVLFNSGNWNTPFAIKVSARDDSVPEDPHNTTIKHTIDVANTGDTAYKASGAVQERRLDVRVIDDENPGLYQVESLGKTLVSAGNPQNGHGLGDSYTLRLTGAPKASVDVALVSDGQTDIAPGGSITYKAIGGLVPTQLFKGNVTITSNTIARSFDDLGSWVDDGFAVGMRIRVSTEGSADVDGKIASISVDGKSMTLEAGATGLADGPRNDSIVSQVNESGTYNGSIEYVAANRAFKVFTGNLQVTGNAATRNDGGSLIDAGFATGQTVSFGTGTGKFTVTGFSVDEKTMTLSGSATGTYTGASKWLGTLRLTNGSSWLDSGFLEGQLFQLSDAAFAGKTFKIDLITGTTGDKLDLLVVADPPNALGVVPGAAKLTNSVPATATMTVTQWAAVATFSTVNWFTPVTVNVVSDPGFDIQPGHENLRQFPKIEHRLDGIRGPLSVEGGATNAVRTLRQAVMLPGENNGPLFNVPPQPPEWMSIDTLNIYDDGSRQDLTGTLTSTALTGLNMGSDLDLRSSVTGYDPLNPGATKPPFGEPGIYPGGIGFGSISLDKNGNFTTDGGRSTIEVLNVMLGQGNDKLAIQGTLVPGPDHDTITGAETTVSMHGGITAVHGGGNALLQVNGRFTFANTANGNAELGRADLLKWTDYGFAVGQRVVLSTPAGSAAFTVTGFAGQPGGNGSKLLLAGGSAAVSNQAASFTGSVAVVDDLSVGAAGGTFTVQSDRIIRNDNLPWQNLGFAKGDIVAFTTGGVTKLYTVVDFDNNTLAGLGSAILLSGNTLTTGNNAVGVLAEAGRFSVSGNITAAAPTATTGTLTLVSGTWVAAGFAAGQSVMISGQPGTLTVKSAIGNVLTLQGGAIVQTGAVQRTVGIVRTGGDTITVSGVAAVSNGTFNVAPGQITRTDANRWDTDLHFAIGQQISVNGYGTGAQKWLTQAGLNGETAAQLAVTAISADGKTLSVSGTPLNTGTFAATVQIDSPLVVYGDTSQDGVWYNGKPDKLSLGIFGHKPQQHEDGLAVTFGGITTQYGKKLSTITRNDAGGSWTTSGFVPEGLLTVDGTLVGTIREVSADGKTLTVILADLTKTAGVPGDDLSGIWPGAAGNGVHNFVQRNRLGESADFFVFPLANPYLRAGNDVIDASALYAAIPDGQLPTSGLTAYGGQGDDLIKGSQAGDLLAGGSGNDQIWGGRGVDLSYGDAGFNADLITRDLYVASTAKKNPTDPATKNLDSLVAGRDLIFGDKPGSTASNIYGDYDDVIIGDLGRVTQDVAGPRDTTKAAPALPQALQTTLRSRIIVTLAPQIGADDQLYGNGGQDVLLGGTGNDAIDGGLGMDLVLGDHASLDRTAKLNDFTSLRFEALTGTQIYSTAPTTAGQDLASNVARLDPRGDAEGRFKQTYGSVWGDYVVTEVGHADGSVAAYKGNDYIAGGAGDDTILGELGNDVIQGDGSIDFVAYQSMYDATGAVVTTPTIRGRVGASRGADGPDASLGGATTGTLTWFASFDNPTTDQKNNDGHDYIEGGGGSDVVFGNQGQDDIVGGSSDFFKKTDGVTPTANNTPDKRPDTADLLFGGSGTATARNEKGAATIDATLGVITTTATGHADDADTILGDNGDIIRLVGTNNTVRATPSFLIFNYDNYGSIKIVPRIARLLDYTPGGPNYAGPGVLTSDRGGNDEVHGESGDDFVYGTTGNDRLFGDGQDDDLIGGWGNDWISGGTGDDGVIGDDGRIFTGRNSVSADPANAGYLTSLGEPLFGIVPLKATDADPKNTNGDVLNEFIYTPGSIQTATINVSGALKKTVDITPFSTDVNWNGTADEYGILGKKGSGTGGVGVQPAHYNDDVIFGGLGSDWLHGGSGDDAISGAEALPLAAAGIPSDTVLPLADGTVVVDSLSISGWLRPYNPGNILAFDPVDANGQHANHRSRAGELALYDEYNPLRRLVVAGNVAGTHYQFLLNFNETEGVLQPAGSTPAPQSINYPAVNVDGSDRIFGDLGNDWLVGGTGRDDMYGGMGNDLMNADDNLGTDGNLNDQPDTAPTYEDRAFGGGGRDVLIANTGGDRLIDWTGEFNSYLVPFAPFGMATVSRTVQPQLPEFLYALSGSDGADATRYSDTNNGAAPPAPTNSDPMPSRNGEPRGELGLVLQKDDAWQDTHGGPSDPQAGNIPGGKRDVLRSASFDNGTAQGFVPVSGTWAVTNGRYNIASTGTDPDALSLFNESDTVIPSYFEMQATINAVKPTSGTKANAFLIFDFINQANFKFAGFDVSTNKLIIGHRDATGWVTDNWTNSQLKAGNDYIVMLTVNDLVATLTLGTSTVSYTYTARVDGLGVKHNLKDGLVGIGANNAAAQIDNVVVQAPPGAITLDKTADFGATLPASVLFGAAQSGTWATTTDGRFVGNTTTTTPAIDFINPGKVPITAGSLLEITSVLRTAGRGGVVFDYQGANAYKYVTLSADARQLVIGHVRGNANVVDGTYAVSVSANTDYTLQVSLRGGLVNVSLNGSVVLSKLYQETVTEGQYGIASFKGTTSGQTSFDNVRVRTDEVGFAVPAPLVAVATASTATMTTPAAPPNSSDIAALLAEAKHRWALAGIGAQALAAMDLVSVDVADLGGENLGNFEGTHLVIDDDAAGYGWFVDATPRKDEEFVALPSGDLRRAIDTSPAAGKMDLLTVVMHELGHGLGLGDLDMEEHPHELMTEALAPGIRRLPAGVSVLPDPAKSGVTLLPAGEPMVHPIGLRYSFLAASGPRSPAVNVAVLSTSQGPSELRQRVTGSSRGAATTPTRAPGVSQPFQISDARRPPEILYAVQPGLYEERPVDARLQGLLGRGRRVRRS